MTEIVGLLADAELGVAAFEFEAAAGDPHEANHHAQQRGFSRAIAAANRERFAGADREIHAGEDGAAAAPAGHIDRGKPHHSGPTCGNTSAAPAQNRRWQVAPAELN